MFKDIKGISFTHALSMDLDSTGFPVVDAEGRQRNSRKRELNSQDDKLDIVRILGLSKLKRRMLRRDTIEIIKNH